MDFDLASKFILAYCPLKKITRKELAERIRTTETLMSLFLHRKCNLLDHQVNKALEILGVKKRFDELQNRREKSVLLESFLLEGEADTKQAGKAESQKSA